MTMYIKIAASWNMGSLGIAQNTYTLRWSGAINPLDSVLLSAMSAYLTSIYVTSGLTGVMHSSCTSLGAQVSEITASGALVRIIGGISPAISGTSGGDMNAGPTAMSGTARTNVPKVRGSKRFPGVIDSGVVGQLLTNSVMSFLVAAVSRWISGAGSTGGNYVAGVPSTRTGGWVDFNLTGLVKNVPGTQVTRKPLRGA